MRKTLTKKANDLTALAPKWSERGHLLAALPKHLAETQEAIKTQQNIDKEMTDLALIASAWMKSQQQKELLEARLKRFKETAGYPSMASKTYYHGSPDSNIGSLRAGSYVSPDKRIAEIMGRFHEGTGKTWTDEDLSKPYDFGPDIHWKSGREPMGKPNIYSINASPEQLDLLNNPYEHRLKSDMTTEKLARAEKFGSSAGKAAASNILEKSAIEVIRPYPKHKLTHFLPEQARKSTLTLDEANSIAKAMDTAARYGALNDTQVQLNGAKLIGLQNRAIENKRNSALTKWMAGMADPFEGLPDKVQSVPDAYLPTHDTVWLPSGNPAIMMHELGHATDMNEFPNTPFRRFVAGTYQNYAPTLWKEHAAWIKGQNRLIEGAAKTKVDPNLIVRTLEDTARVKPTGLGSYWGAGIGALAGAGLGTAAFLGSHGNPGMIRAIPLGLLLGTALGGITGLQAGKLLGGRESLGSDKAKQKYLEIYANQYAKEHGMTLDEAKIELNNLMKKKPKVISKAASFGNTMGKQAGIFWKKLDKPVGIKSVFGNEDDPSGPDDPVDFDKPTVHARLGAYRTMEPRLLTRLFSSPSKDYKHMLAGMKSVVDRDPAPGEGGTGLESPIGRAIWASSALPSMFPDRYSFGTDAPLGNEDVFEDTRTPYYKGMQEHFKKRLSPLPEAWKQITNPEILNPKVKGGGIKIEDIKPEAFEDKDEDLGEDADWINALHNQLTDPDAEFNKKWTLTSFNRHSDSESKKPKASKKGLSSKAASFGAMMGKQAALDPAVANALGLGAAGMAGGGLLGALSGAIDPGYEDKEKRKRMSRLRAAIYGGLGGASLGGLGGAILGGGGTELMRVSPKIENWIMGQKLKSQTDIPVDVVNDLKNKAVNFNVWAANRNYDDLGRDAHFEYMRKGMPKDQENWVEVFGKKVSPSWRSGPDWRINLNPGEPRATDNLFNQMGPTVVDNPFSRSANKAVDLLSKLVSKKDK